MTEEKREIEGFLLTEDGTAQFIKIKDELHTYYDLLGCDTIDMTSRMIGGLRYEFIVDDNGLLTERQPTVFDIHGQPHLVGSVFVCLINEENGECMSLTKTHEAIIVDNLYYEPKTRRIVLVVTIQGGGFFHICKVCQHMAERTDPVTGEKIMYCCLCAHDVDEQCNSATCGRFEEKVE